ncbi:MAG: NAD+ synthase [Candidatus Omnitrophica bacterium]|nr:NAD+ synthase [Candidatus Omnitrophota bacterium]
MIKIALAQINSIVGGLKENTDKIISFITTSKEKGVDLLVFPELSLVGYPPEDLLLKKHFIAKNKHFLKSITASCTDIAVLVGYVDKIKDKIYNSCAFISNKQIHDTYHKIILPNYSVFDEKRYFTPGDSIRIYEFNGYKFAISICADIWENRMLELLKDKGLDFILNMSASPFYLDKVTVREKILSNTAKVTKSFVFYCNLVGGQDEIVFDGTSKIFSSKGELVARAKRFEEDLLMFDFSKKKKYLIKNNKVIKEEEAFLALRLGLFDYVEKNKFKKVIVGVSGGIDSAVVVALAAITLGKENVCALIMPSVYNSKATVSDAKTMCVNLGIEYHIVGIDNILHTYSKDLVKYFNKIENDKTEENLQARIRGNILMAFSNKFGYLVLNTGNKSEVSCGYCTLYGDMVGGFGVLKDVPKLLVYKISHYINKYMGKKVIPASLIGRPPSAELKYNQKDSDSLPPYDVLDQILKLYVEEDQSIDYIVKSGFKKSIVKKVIKLVDSNEYKRRQAPIGIKITPKAFGKDRRMPITNKFSQ